MEQVRCILVIGPSVNRKTKTLIEILIMHRFVPTAWIYWKKKFPFGFQFREALIVSEV